MPSFSIIACTASRFWDHVAANVCLALRVAFFASTVLVKIKIVVTPQAPPAVSRSPSLASPPPFSSSRVFALPFPFSSLWVPPGPSCGGCCSCCCHLYHKSFVPHINRTTSGLYAVAESVMMSFARPPGVPFVRPTLDWYSVGACWIRSD